MKRQAATVDGCPTRFHGRYSDAGHGCVCPGAIEAKHRREKLWRSGHLKSAKVDPTGTVRRLHALVALGWSYRLIGKEVRLAKTTIAGHAEQPRAFVLQDTADRIAAVYERLSGTPGPSKLSRDAAARNSWAPPHAWEDIDRDDEPEHVAPNEPIQARRSSPETTEEVRHLRRFGLSVFDIAEQMQVKPESLERAAYRAGDHRLASLLHAERTAPERATA